MGSNQNRAFPRAIFIFTKFIMVGRSIESKRHTRNLRKKKRRQQRRDDRAKMRGVKMNAQVETAIRAAHKETDGQKQLASKYCSLWRKSIKENKGLKLQLLHKENKRVRKGR